MLHPFFVVSILYIFLVSVAVFPVFKYIIFWCPCKHVILEEALLWRNRRWFQKGCSNLVVINYTLFSLSWLRFKSMIFAHEQNIACPWHSMLPRNREPSFCLLLCTLAQCSEPLILLFALLYAAIRKMWFVVC